MSSSPYREAAPRTPPDGPLRQTFAIAQPSVAARTGGLAMGFLVCLGLGAILGTSRAVLRCARDADGPRCSIIKERFYVSQRVDETFPVTKAFVDEADDRAHKRRHTWLNLCAGACHSEAAELLAGPATEYATWVNQWLASGEPGPIARTLIPPMTLYGVNFLLVAGVLAYLLFRSRRRVALIFDWESRTIVTVRRDAWLVPRRTVVDLEDVRGAEVVVAGQWRDVALALRDAPEQRLGILRCADVPAQAVATLIDAQLARWRQ